MTESKVNEVFNPRDFAVSDAVFYYQSGQLALDDVALNRLLSGSSPTGKNFALRRLKFLFHRCSRGVREGRIPVEAVNNLSTFCLEIIPLIESGGIVMPTAAELGILVDWYLDVQTRAPLEPAVVITTVCPDYPFEWIGTKAVFKSGTVGNGIGLVGESILNTGPRLLHILSKSLNITFDWIVGYAGFEAKQASLESMKITAEEFRDRLETSARKMQRKLGAAVGILPDAVGVTLEQFNEIRDGFKIGDFNIKRKGMDALSDAVDARDWAGVFSISNRLNAIILDGASVYMGRKAYGKAGQILKSTNHTPRFFCVSNYMGFDS